MTLNKELIQLNQQMEGSLHWDTLHQKMYATDASVYRKNPMAVAYPKSVADVKLLLSFCRKNKIGVIPRTAGTSLAGQCVGPGLVVDVSKHFNAIISLDEENKTVTVQPGVIRDDLNRFLAPYGLFFGPNTSTSSRCMMGGMVGNNSSGTTSIRYGVTRDKVLEMKTVLSDGSSVHFKPLKAEGLAEKCKLNNTEGRIYKNLIQWLEDPKVRQNLKDFYPPDTVHRRNTGYALDTLLETQPLNGKAMLPFNMCKILAGSEGTLAFTTSITLALEPLPPPNAVMVAAHFETIAQSMQAVLPVMQHQLFTCELMDKTILDCTLQNPTQIKNRFFLKGDPKAILLLELRNDDLTELEKELRGLCDTLERSGLSYAFPVLRGDEINSALQLRHAGLGLLGNIVGDDKAVACIEDTAVPLEHLAAYIADFQKLMQQFGQDVVYYAHAGAGELHLRPILNLKTKKGVQDFRAITHAVAKLAKQYNGSLSGEHGDGIVRSEFIPLMVGEENYDLFKKVKSLFDPFGIMNPGKIVHPFPMDKNLRYEPDIETREIKTAFDFSSDMGLLRAAEKCNGSGECRTEAPAGTMCPSYRATRNEKDSTRGRANILREVLTHNPKQNPFDHPDLKAVFDLCLACKACASECPSSVDVATYKSEFLYQYQKQHGVSLRDWIFAHTALRNRLGQPLRRLQNAILNHGLIGNVLKRGLRIAPQRQLPPLERALFPNIQKKIVIPKKTIKTVYLFLDEFSNYMETDIGKDAVALLTRLGYAVKLLPSTDSGRTFISKGFLEKAKKCANQNVNRYSEVINAQSPLLGIEPSAIYTFKDEYPKLCDFPEKAKTLAKNCYLLDEFLAYEAALGNIGASAFHKETKTIKIHAHCYQKAMGNPSDTFKILNLPENYTVTLLNTGCCGMAGAFGYEKEHYELSMKVGEERLFPAVRKADDMTIIAANGTSCRHQIADGTQRKALHPVSVLRQALR